MPSDTYISLNEASRRSGVPASTLKRWAEEKVLPVKGGRWTKTAAAQARVVARMRERGYTLEQLRDAGREGKLSLPVGLARGQVRLRCTKPRAALNLLPASRELIACYRGLIERRYPQLVIS